MAPAPNSLWSSSILSPQGMMFCLSGSPEVKGVRDAHLTSGSVSPIPFHTPAGLSTRRLSSLHVGFSFPPFADAPPAPVSSFSALWAIFSDLTQFMSSVTGAFHPHHPKRELLVPICFTWFDEGRRKDIFSFPLQCLSSSQELSLISRFQISVSWGHGVLFQVSYLWSFCQGSRDWTAWLHGS